MHSWQHRFGVLLSSGSLQRTLMYQAIIRSNFLEHEGSSWEKMEHYKDWNNEIDKLNQRAVDMGVPHVKAFQTCSAYPLMATEIAAVNGIIVAVSVSASFAILSIYLFIGSIQVHHVHILASWIQLLLQVAIIAVLAMTGIIMFTFGMLVSFAWTLDDDEHLVVRHLLVVHWD